MSDLRYEFRPLGLWAGPSTSPLERRRGQFKAQYEATLDLLFGEAEKLDAKHLVLQVDLQQRDIRADGLPRARACYGDHPEVNRLSSTEGGPVDAYAADIRINCANCGEAFRWMGLQAGISGARPMVSVDEATLHAPVRPASADPDFGLGIPGFAIRVRL